MNTEQPDTPNKDQGVQEISQKYASGEMIECEGSKESYGPQPRLIPKKYQEILKNLCQKIAQRDQFARIEEVKRAAIGRFYWRGQFNVVCNDEKESWETLDDNPSLGFADKQTDSGDVALHYPINIYQSYGRGHITVVAEPWKIRMKAKKEDEPDALRITNSADTMREEIEAKNDLEKLRDDAARLSWTDGRVSFYQRWVTDGARFGYEDDKHQEDDELEGVGGGDEPPPKKKRQPKGGELTTAYGVLECKVPINMRNSSQFPWRQLAFEIDKTSAKAMYPWIGKRITGGQPGPGEYAFDRTTRIACTQGIRLVQQTGDTVEQLPTWQQTWLRPSFFLEIEKDDDREWFEDNYPDGAYVAFVGETYCMSRNESMDDHWEDTHPLPGDGQATPACGEIIMPVQDALLDLTDLKMEREMKSIPAVWCNKNAGINLQAISKERAGPGAHYGVEIDPNAPGGVAAQFFVEDVPQAPADEDAMWDALMNAIPQALTGLYPAAIGESDPNNQTLGGIKLLTQASRGQSGVAWSSFRKTFSRVMTQLIRIGAYFRAGEADDNGTVTINDVNVDLEDLRDGNWACEPDGDESYPNTHAEQREALIEALQIPAASPFASAIASVPKNMLTALQLIGIKNLELPGADTEEKELAMIKLMLNETPVPTDAQIQYVTALRVAPLTGQAPPQQPTADQMWQSSQPTDPEVDDSATAYQVLKNWLNSSSGVQAMRDRPDGYKNVRMRMLEHKKNMQAEQQQQLQQQKEMMLLTEQVKHPPKSAKQVSESINFKDLGPSGQLQVGAQAGLDLSADVGADLAASHVSPATNATPVTQ